jgi:carboxypeptidase C (cathepsin A)
MPLKSETGETEANVFYMAYTLDGVSDRAARPLMFSFNGGPGSSSVWLHLGALGPYRVEMQPEGFMPSAPYRVVENPSTWLDKTDLVFIDPVGTGYSRAAKPELGKKYWSLDGDIASVGEFIRLYLGRNNRWASPLYLVGESYGTTRAAGLSGYLFEKGIAFNGVLLISSILNFGTTDVTKGNDLPYFLYLPTFTATAWYHKRLAPDLQKDLKKTLTDVEKFVTEEYVPALAKGDDLSPKERQAIVDKLSRYTGLSKAFVENSDLRISMSRFSKELMRDKKRTVGRLDSRFLGIDSNASGANPEYDPSMTAIRTPYTAGFNDYVRTKLGFHTDLEYYILGGGIKGPWDFGNTGRGGFVDTSESLREAMVKNPYMKVFVASGYYDQATPYFATRYTLSHLGLDPSLKGNFRLADFEAGHMMYIDITSLSRLKEQVAAFLDWSQKKP